MQEQQVSESLQKFKTHLPSQDSLGMPSQGARRKGSFSFLRLFNHQIWVRNVNENHVSARCNSLRLTPLFHFQHSTYNQELSESPVKIIDYPRSGASPKNINMITGHVHRHLSEFSEFLGAYYSKGTIKGKISDMIGGKLTYSQKALPNFLCIWIAVVQSLSSVRLCDPMDCNTPGSPVLHYFPALVQTHVHWVSDAIQPSHSLSSTSPSAFNLSKHQGLFPMSWLFASDGQSTGASALVLPVNIQDWFPLGLDVNSSMIYTLCLQRSVEKVKVLITRIICIGKM